MEGKTIECRAAVKWDATSPPLIETIQVAPPKQGEVRIKILYTGVCHSDLFYGAGLDGRNGFPVILGHEAAGVVESLGPGVTNVQPGDHVIPIFLPQCGQCGSCKHPRANTCEKLFAMLQSPAMLDGTTRMTCKGQPLKQMACISSFSEYSVVLADALCKVDKSWDLSKICLLSCGVSTGYGAALNTAKVTPGSTCAVWGLGTIGLSAVMGCKAAGAKQIIAVDVLSDKFDFARKLGATDCINPKDHDQPIQQVIAAMTNGGAEFTIECVGNAATVKAAFEASHPAYGVSVVVGLAPMKDDVIFKPIQLLTGRTWAGSFYGGWKSVESLPRLLEDYKSGKIDLDTFITHRLPLEKIAEAFEMLEAGKSLRTVLTVGKE